MRKRVVILGGGTGRTLAANRLRRELPDDVTITVVDRDDDHLYQPGLLFVPFGLAQPEAIEANLFFTFFGLDAIHKARHEHIKLATVGNPGLHLATWAGGLPGMSSAMTQYMSHKLDQLDIPPIPEFIEMIADTGAGLYACQASVDLFGLTRDDFIDQVKDIITVGEFYGLAAGGQTIFT
jgi:peroxiredoxin family protein